MSASRATPTEASPSIQSSRKLGKVRIWKQIDPPEHQICHLTLASHILQMNQNSLATLRPSNMIGNASECIEKMLIVSLIRGQIDGITEGERQQFTIGGPCR
jgi:hypothetical protein